MGEDKLQLQTQVSQPVSHLPAGPWGTLPVLPGGGYDMGAVSDGGLPYRPGLLA